MGVLVWSGLVVPRANKPNSGYCSIVFSVVELRNESQMHRTRTVFISYSKTVLGKVFHRTTVDRSNIWSH